MKICFKCGKQKPLSAFYKHAMMKDGHLNKCKECTKEDSKKIYDKNIVNPLFRDSERKRGRDKFRRLYAGNGKANSKANNAWMERFPEKREATLKSQRLKKPFDGAEKHHWSYSEDHYKDVIWLSKKDHMKAHRFIVYDQERKKYRRIDTAELLDTKELHDKYIQWCILNKED